MRSHSPCALVWPRAVHTPLHLSAILHLLYLFGTKPLASSHSLRQVLDAEAAAALAAAAAAEPLAVAKISGNPHLPADSALSLVRRGQLAVYLVVWRVGQPGRCACCPLLRFRPRPPCVAAVQRTCPLACKQSECSKRVLAAPAGRGERGGLR